MSVLDSPWIEVCPIDGIPLRGCRVVRTRHMQIALFRTASDEVFALENRCPHKNGPLSEGIVHDRKVTCPFAQLGHRPAGRQGDGRGQRLRPKLPGQAP